MAKDYRYLLQDLQRAEERTKPKINPEQKLTLCMIARNEEEYIAGALKSVQGLVDEIIVVDTGSTDKTVEVAREYGAKVFFMEWQNDFAAARNEALKHATGDWILILDADERVADEHKENLRSLLIPTDQALSYLLYIRNYLSEEDESTVLGHYMVRLFRKTPETRFFGVIHEQLYPNWGEVTIPENTFYINHLGYAKQDKKADKIENRNLPLIQKALEQTRGKNDSLYSFYAFYMGSSLSDPHEVKKWLKEAIDICPDPLKAAHLPIAYLDHMRALYYLRDFKAGIQSATEAIQRIPSMQNFPDFLDFLGVLYLADAQYDAAITSFERTLQLSQSDGDEALFFAARTSRIGSWGTYLNLGLAMALNGDQTQAKANFVKAIDSYPSEDKTKIAARIDQIMGNANLTHAYFQERISQEATTSYDTKILSNIYLKQEKPFEAIMLQHELHGPEKAIETALSLAQTYEQHQRFELALKTYEGILSLSPEHLGAQLGKLAAELMMQQVQLEVSEIEALSQKCQSIQDCQALGAFCLRFGLVDLASEAFAKVLAEDADHYDANLYLALVEQEREETDAASSRLQKLIQHHPEHIPAYIQLGNLELFMGQFSEAESRFRQVLEKQVNTDWYSHYGLGVALSGQERFDEAEAALRQSLKHAPGHAAPIGLLALIAQAKQAVSANN